jgi:short subunit dehydrogenase-like uncharacterized protein
MAAMTIGPLRRAAAARMPAPGAGPSKQARETGYWDVRLLAETLGVPPAEVLSRAGSTDSFVQLYGELLR